MTWSLDSAYTRELAELTDEERDAEPGEVAGQRRPRQQVGDESEAHHRATSKITPTITARAAPAVT